MLSCFSGPAPLTRSFLFSRSSAISPTNWHEIPGSVTSSNGTFLFLDNGTNSGGLLTPRFYRLRQVP